MNDSDHTRARAWRGEGNPSQAQQGRFAVDVMSGEMKPQEMVLPPSSLMWGLVHVSAEPVRSKALGTMLPQSRQGSSHISRDLNRQAQ